jgi:hypothetical protein
MSDLKLTPSLLSLLERIERNSGTLLMLAVTGQWRAGREAKQAPGCRVCREMRTPDCNQTGMAR